MGKESNVEGTIRRVGFALVCGRIYSRKHCTCTPVGWMALFHLVEHQLQVHLGLGLPESA
jgi:hypothetical protein